MQRVVYMCPDCGETFYVFFPANYVTCGTCGGRRPVEGGEILRETIDINPLSWIKRILRKD